MNRATRAGALNVFYFLRPAVWLLFVCVVCFVCGGCSGSHTPAKAKAPGSAPNIVLIILDALRADKLGCYGFDAAEGISPEIDAIAREGVLFENVISQCSWTRPSVGSMLTSLYPRSIGIYKEKYDILHDKYVTLAEVLKNNGYFTFGITANPNINKFFNFHQGFDDYVESSVIWGWMKPEAGKTKYKDHPFLPGSRQIFNKVLEKAKSHGPGSAPTYIQINVMEVHSPHIIRPKYRDSFKDYPVKKINAGFSHERFARVVRGTLAAVRQVSHDTGRFVNRLCALPGWENTLVVITSDHGQGLDDHPDVYGAYLHGNLLYGSQLRVPLIFYHTGKPTRTYTPHRVKTRVRLLELMPTILDYAGISLPGGHKIHGNSVLPALTGRGKMSPLPDYFVAETNWRDVAKIAVYTGNWNYFENRDHWKGVNRRELQPVGTVENGKVTDKISGQAEFSKKMKSFLYRWEKKYKRAKPVFPKGKLSQKEIDQLKSLGYLK